MGFINGRKVIAVNKTVYMGENINIDATPNGIDTSTNILAYTEDKGIYVGSDTGHWYYWNGSQYADGGTYQSTVIADGDAFKPFANIASSADLNDYMTIGSYWVESGSQTNKPSDFSNGMLLVFTSNSYGNPLFQLLLDEGTGIRYVRRKYEANWTSWVKQQSGFYGKDTEVSIDLNNYLTEGSYWKPSGYSIANDPLGSSWNGTLLVFEETASGPTKVVWQMLINNDTFYIRRVFGTSFGAWTELKTGFYGKTYVQTDFNNYTKEGSFWIPSGVSISNSPSFSGTSWNGMLLVFEATYNSYAVVFQIAFNSAETFIRRKFGSTWGDWTSNVISNSSITGKKWYACGDSFTAQGYGPSDPGYGTDSVLPSGTYKGYNAVYPYYIGNRTGCVVVNTAVGGMTMSSISGYTNSFTYNDAYKTLLGADADLITLYFGINDIGHGGTVGTIDDETNATFCGAYNNVLSWIFENRPNARVGIIVSNGTNSEDLVNATIAIAKKWGVPYLNIDGDPMLPLVIRTTTRPNLSATRKQQLLETYAVNYPSNTHPNYIAHEKESYMIQQFLERL